MLDQLVESRNQSKERAKISGFMFSTGVVLLTVLTAGLVFSLFNQNIVLGADRLEISALVAPVQIEPKPEPVVEPKPQAENSAEDNQTKVPQRKDNVLRLDETPREIPKGVSVTPSDAKARPNVPFTLGNSDIDPKVTGSNRTATGTGISGDPIGTSIANNTKVIEHSEKDPAPPPITKTLEPKPQGPVSGGVVNGKAIDLVTPNYPAAARSLGIKGQVRVQVLIDEEGNVVSASVVSGHPLLKESAVRAARASTFTPTTLSKHKVKVTGVIIYNFA